MKIKVNLDLKSKSSKKDETYFYLREYKLGRLKK